ncbi:1,4-alpha-glucan branching protein GlgB [Sulfuriferula nivalis]|uniref:1,4-alpha-glucan branching enzyme GlgB n=1 Tax=Sulfuriferula nivalis TaxID=2675298 RepID=A0A809RQY4_9PROT|nr:1,4-alpha-glucan branching protein GlgB [Sulfuriferula nivalis]BBP01271.1 1,4-alpha-glucan branching enzyme GlgB [Sulfuriferula nivalis]
MPITKLNISRIQQGTHHDPFNVLGWHQQTKDESWLLRVFMPAAEQVALKTGEVFSRLKDTDIFELKLPVRTEQHPVLRWQSKADLSWLESISPYTFTALIGELDLYLLGEGRHYDAWHILGAHLDVVDGVAGCQFAVWAPGVQRVSVIGDFNGWDGRSLPMRSRGQSGVWELFVPGLEGGWGYKYEILGAHGQLMTKADPYAQQSFNRPETISCIPVPSQHDWQDRVWLAQRAQFDWQHKPISTYELHVGSWRRHPDGTFYSWAELAESLIPYLTELAYTHIELLPIAEHPLDESWGYQVTGYFAPTARFGLPDDFRAFVDACHQAGLGVILDWVPAHFPKDDFALARFTGETLYEHPDPRRGEHQDWGTLIFDYGRNEVKNFLLANALYWIDEFHIDGLRVDAVASMLYLDYSRKAGEWAANQYGGRENLEAIAFLRELNTVLHGRFAGVLTIAEESTAWPMVSRPVELGGLGFSMKWNMGWMNDNLSYIEEDPVHRKYHHNQLTFSQIYAYTENFFLPLSHDEVVHMKGSMLDKMPGDYWQKFANLRLFYAWQYAHPGKKLLFMGSEFGQWNEWRDKGELDWTLCQFPIHHGVQRLVGDLNRLYQNEVALHQYDFNSRGFSWIDCHDSDQSVLSLMRNSDEEHVLAILNFTPVPRLGYRIGVPQAGRYQELLNTDSDYYGGSNCGNAGELHTQDVPWMGFAQSLVLVVPPLAAVFLKRVVS